MDNFEELLENILDPECEELFITKQEYTKYRKKLAPLESDGIIDVMYDSMGEEYQLLCIS